MEGSSPSCRRTTAPLPNRPAVLASQISRADVVVWHRQELRVPRPPFFEDGIASIRRMVLDNVVGRFIRRGRTHSRCINGIPEVFNIGRRLTQCG
jgi:hypothetical protein